MKYKKCQIKHIVLLSIAVVLAVPILSGCASVDRVDFPFERAQKRAQDKAAKKTDADVRYGSEVVINDGDILGFTSEVIKILGKEEKNYRIIRKISTTLGVLAGTIATSIHGAVGADADTVSMFSAGAVLTPLLQQIWGAGEASQAKRKGINLISDAQSRYYNSISTGNNGGEVNNKRITPAGAALYKEVMAALTVVGNAISNQIPSLKDLKVAMGEVEEDLDKLETIKIVPNTLALLKNGVDTATVIKDSVIAVTPVKPNIVKIINTDDLEGSGTSRIKIRGVTKGNTRVEFFNDRGDKGTINVIVETIEEEGGTAGESGAGEGAEVGAEAGGGEGEGS